MRKPTRLFSISLFLLSSLAISFNAHSDDATLLHYKPHASKLQYNLSISRHSEVDMGQARLQGEIFENHEDTMVFSQKINGVGDGLLGINLTLDRLNPLERPYTGYGVFYNRKDAIGNTNHIVIDLLGRPKEVKFFPHFGSRAFHNRSADDPILDIYRVMVMVYPQFPLKRLRVGESWRVKDKVAVTTAEVLPIRGIGERSYSLEMEVSKDIEYTLVGYVQRGGYRAAHISFEGSFSTEGSVFSASTGDYVSGSGKSSGDYYFALEEGLLIEGSIKSRVTENKSQDGSVAKYVVPSSQGKPRRVFVYHYDQRSLPLIWRTDQTAVFKLNY